jgi:PhnB protein
MSKHPQLIPYLVVRNGLQAIKFYEEAFGATAELVLTDDDGKRVMHAALEIDGNALFYLCDEFGAENSAAVSPETLGKSSVILHLLRRKPHDVDAVMAKAILHGAQVVLAPHDASWGDRYGQIRDPFGQVWSFGAHLKSRKAYAHDGT